MSHENTDQSRLADSSINTEDFGYTYDPAWNLQYRTNNGGLSALVVDPKNELTNAFDAAYTYDANGNLVSGTNGHTAYVYDEENRLAQWFWFAEDAAHYTNGALRTDFIYDGVGRLRIRIESYIAAPNPTNPPPEEAILRELLEGQSPEAPWLVSSETHYIYDGLRVIQERDGSNTPLDSITRGNDLSGSLEGAGGIGGLLARSGDYSGGNWTSHACYFADGNGNITSLLDASQWPVARYRYDPFGNTVYKYGALADANVYRFSSKELHVASGMYYYLYRFYDPNLQRWVNRDPINERGGLNLYSFLLNRPIATVDPFGLQRGMPPPAPRWPGDRPPSPRPGGPVEPGGEGGTEDEGGWEDPNNMVQNFGRMGEWAGYFSVCLIDWLFPDRPAQDAPPFVPGQASSTANAPPVVIIVGPNPAPVGPPTLPPIGCSTCGVNAPPPVIILQ